MYKELIEQIIPTLNFKFPYYAEEYADNMILENYHSHSSYSNVYRTDSATDITEYSDRIKQLGGKCIYTMEHGWQGNVHSIYDIAENNGHKLIVGTEGYWVKDRHDTDKTNNHIVIQAKNEEGRQDINYALSVANEDGFYYVPRIDLELLMNIPKDNVIVTSACTFGWKYEDAENLWLKIHEHFGDNFYFEVQNHDTDSQKILNEKILKLADKEGVQIICGLDSHYIFPEDSIKRDQILHYKGVEYPEEYGWYMDYPDTKTVIERFHKQGILSDSQIVRSIMNTNIFASDAVDIIKFDRNFKIPTIYKGKTYDEKCQIYKDVLNKAYKKEKFKSKNKADGIRYEVNEVIQSKVVDYFLTSRQIVKDGVENEGGILTTTARGSASSFVTNKLLGLTTVDRFTSEVPMYPERFLTKERVLSGQMPDIDLNVASQEPFVRAARKLLGEHGCYPLMRINKLKEKDAWQMYASNAGIDPTTANQISKFLDNYNKAIKHADEDDKDSILIEDYIPEEYLPVFEASINYRNITIGAGTHACGHLLLNWDIRREIGLISTVNQTTKVRTICAAIEGGFLDEFGFVKEDFLIVDAVSLTYELFKAIGKEVPSFDELKSMVNGDKATWDIYEKGIVCCVNQCAKDQTRVKVMKYKPKNIGELSQFIAAIRPGFASLLSTFLDRKPYTTGEPRIDDLLKDTSHFMIYQENIMMILSFLHLQMGATYKVIKSISKKKLKGEKLEHLLEELNTAWQEEFDNLNNFNKVWEVIRQSAYYAFNASHSYSMAGDSLYQAWFKAHHTKIFYEVAIKHYQRKNEKDKIDDLVKEAIKYYGYSLGEYEFGKDNRTVNLNEETKTIYPNISSIKGIGEAVGDQLYELGKNPSSNFVEEIKLLYGAKINKTIVDNLIKINYFSMYGGINKLLQIKIWSDVLKNGESKSISKDKAREFGIPIEILQKNCKETPAQYSINDMKSLLNDLIDSVPETPTTIKQTLSYECDVLGMCKTVYPNVNNHYFFVTDIESNKSVTTIYLYTVNSGINREVKMWNNSFVKDIFEKNELLYITKIEKKNKKQATDKINPKTGKKIWEEIPDQYEYWLQNYIKRDKI